MEEKSQDCKSQCIEMESLTEESQENRRSKKTAGVRFVPDIPPDIQNESHSAASHEEDNTKTKTSNDIKSEICSLLPSNTLGRRKLRTLSRAKDIGKKSLIATSTPSTSNDNAQFEEKRSEHYSQKRRSFIQSLNIPSSKNATTSEIESDVYVEDDYESFTEEEKMTELLGIRNCPIRMSEKRVYRDAILQALPSHSLPKKSCGEKFAEGWRIFKQSLSSLALWSGSLKSIEGLHGTGVVSYFVFLRWLILINTLTFIIFFMTITLPPISFSLIPFKQIDTAPTSSVVDDKFVEKFPARNPKLRRMKRNSTFFKRNNDDIFSNLGTLFDDYLPEEILDVTLHYDKSNYTSYQRFNLTSYCEAEYVKENLNRSIGIISSIQDLLQGTGWLQSTVLFLGFYPASGFSYFGLYYHMPFAIICVLFVIFLLCFVMMIRNSSHGVQEAILTRKSNYLAFSNILFCSWDYCIEDRKSSVIRHQSILQEIKSTLAEERRKQELMGWSKLKKFRIYSVRVFINIFVVLVLWGSYYLIYRVVNYQLKEQQLHRLNNPGVNTLFVQYLSPIVITSLNIFVPIVFNNIVQFESYNRQTQINIALFRTVFLRLSSVFVLVSLLYQQITCQPKDQCGAGINATCRSPRCWETYVGQQLYKLVVTDFFVYVIMFVAYDLPRDIIVGKFENKVTKLVGRQEFDLPNQVLSLVYSQTLCWLGIIYSPLLPAITVMKFVILFYLKKAMVLKYCVPAPIPYKASRSNAMFMIILMLSFFALIVIHGYSLSSIEPSPACSPFRYYKTMLEAIPAALITHLPMLSTTVQLVFSGIILFPAMLLLCIAIYYYWTIVVAHKKMVQVLKAQIVLEGRDKQFLLNRLTHACKGVYG